jgi:hypothetical protein
MPTIEKTLRVLVVDDDREGADSLGLLVEELGNAFARFLPSLRRKSWPSPARKTRNIKPWQ